MKRPAALFFIGVSVVFGSSVIWAQPDISKVELEARQITTNIYLLTPVGGVVGNILVSAGPDGILLVDTGYDQLADKISAPIRRIANAQIRFIFNTHFHGDHVGANAAFAAKGATVIATPIRANALHRL